MATTTSEREVRALHQGTPFDHDIKVDPRLLEEIQRGVKTHEVRVFDRNYQRGQVLRQRGYDQVRQEYTGRAVFSRITNITQPGTYGLPNNIGVMSIRLIGVVESLLAGAPNTASALHPVAGAR
jgi:hypothetical protein